ncbi:MAG: type IX secretion system plug protein domain-containing protein [Bacteroidota bacterium]
MRPLFFYAAISICLLCLTGCPALLDTEAGTQIQKVYPKLITDDVTYQRNIRTVTLYLGNVPESYPVMRLSRREILTLEFDEWLPEDQPESNLYVDLIHCNADWTPSGLVTPEFYEGFFNDRIDQYARSRFTKIPYVHYTYSFPQENEFFKRSGNYLLKVFRNSNPADLVLTRRFIVVDEKVNLALKYQLSDRFQREELRNIAFDLGPGNLDILDPSRDFNVQLLQNFRWDNRLQNLRPTFQNERNYEYQIELQDEFASGNEFRRLELMSTQLYGGNVQDIEFRENTTDVYLFSDKPKSTNKYGARRDRNGSYSVRNDEYDEPWITSDYLNTHFFLKAAQPYEGQVYVFGELTNWQIQPDFRLDYNATNRRYEGNVLIKQGLYDYQYVLAPSIDAIPDPSRIESAHYRGENFYSVIVYFRGPLDRADQLVGFLPINYFE